MDVTVFMTCTSGLGGGTLQGLPPLPPKYVFRPLSRVGPCPHMLRLGENVMSQSNSN